MMTGIQTDIWHDEEGTPITRVTVHLKSPATSWIETGDAGFQIMLTPAALELPEAGQADQGQQNRERGKQEEDVHRPARFMRRALRVTAREEPDIARAATKGLTRPSIAAGAAIRL